MSVSLRMRLPFLAAAIVLGACSDAAALREDATARIPVSGPVAAARGQELAASRQIQAPPKTEVQLPSPITLDACSTWAVEHNRNFRLTISSMERSRLGVTVARSQVYAPRLTGTASRINSHDVTIAGDDWRRDDAALARIGLTTNLGGFTVAPYASQSWNAADAGTDLPYTSAAGISISRRLLNLAESSRQSMPLTSADRTFVQNVNSLQRDQRRLVADASRAFLNLQRAEARLGLRERRLEQSQASFTATRQAVAAGLKAQIEETNAAIDLNQAEIDLLQDRTAVANARDGLLSLLDSPLGAPLTIRPQEITGRLPELPDTEADVQQVLGGHEDLANLRIQLDQALDDARIQHDQLLPQLTGTVSAERRLNGEAVGGGSEREDVVALTLQLDMPLDAWSGERAKYQGNLRLARELRLRINDRSAELERSVREQRRHIDEVAKGVALAEQRVAAEQSKYRATEMNYNTGRVDNLELTRARQSAAQAEVDLLSTRIDLALALAEREVLLPPPGPRKP